MKKLLLVISFLISVTASSQTYFTCNKMKSGAKVNGKWELDDAVATNLIFSVTQRKVTVNDQAHSVYRIYSEGQDSTGSNYQLTTWLAIDEKERKVNLESIRFDDGTFVFVVKYSDTLFAYYLNVSNESL